MNAPSRPPPPNVDNMMPRIVVESAKFCNLRTLDFMHKPWSFQNECMLEALSANACRMTQAQYAALSADEAMKYCLAAGQWPSRCSQLTGVETDRVLPSLPVRNPLTPIVPVVPPPGVPIAMPTHVPEPTWATHDRPLVQSRASYMAWHPPSLWHATNTLGQIVVLLVVLGILTRIVRKRRRRFQ